MTLPSNQDALNLARLLRQAAYTIESLCAQIDRIRVGELPQVGEPAKNIPDPWRDTLRLSVRARKILERLGIQTMDQLTQMTNRELRKSHNCGVCTTNEIVEELARHGLSLAEEKQM